MSDEIEELREELRALKAGADPTSAPEGIRLTPGQLLHKLNIASEDERLEAAGRILEALRSAASCWECDHEGRIEMLQRRICEYREDAQQRTLAARSGLEAQDG